VVTFSFSSTYLVVLIKTEVDNTVIKQVLGGWFNSRRPTKFRIETVLRRFFFACTQPFSTILCPARVKAIHLEEKGSAGINPSC